MAINKNITGSRRLAIFVAGYSIGESNLPLTPTQRRRLDLLNGLPLGQVAAYEGVKPDTIVATVRRAIRRVEPVIEAAANRE